MIVHLGSHRYALVPTGMRVDDPDWEWHSQVQAENPQAVLLISASDSSFTVESIVERIQNIQCTDDVFSDDFISETLLVDDAGQTKVDIEALQSKLNGTHPLKRSSKQWRLTTIARLSQESPAKTQRVPSGPYFLRGKAVFQAWRLYTDEFSCFQTTVLPDTSASPYGFKNLDSIAPNGEGMSVAVPSRAYAVRDPAKPLAGVRVAVKDNFKLQGVKCSMGCRSFLATYDEDTETADYVKVLIDQGAVVIGKTKMTAFASSEKPCDWWDFQCPFNPRADAHLTPGGSSTGSATAAAAYQWLDMCLGSDTYGSVREPASQSAVYGHRCSTDLWGSSKGLYPSSPVFDTLGFLGTNLARLDHFARSSLHKTLEWYPEFPKTILYPVDFFQKPDKDQQAVVETFIRILEDFLGVKRTILDLADRWDKNPPQEAKGRSLADFSYKMGYNPFYYDGYYQYQYFREDHQRKFGKKVYVSPHMQWKWDLGEPIAKSDVDRSLDELRVFQSWFAENVLHADDKSGSSAVLVLPVGPSKPTYRDIYIPPSARTGIDALSFGAFLRLPQLVLPIGQVPYTSRVSGNQENLPIAGSIAGAHGSDLMLINLAREALKSAGWPGEVAHGKEAFPEHAATIEGAGPCVDEPGPR